MREADNASDLAAPAAEEAVSWGPDKGCVRADGLVAHIAGAGEEQERPKRRRERGDPDEPEGHIVAHIKAGAAP